MHRSILVASVMAFGVACGAPAPVPHGGSHETSTSTPARPVPLLPGPAEVFRVPAEQCRDPWDEPEPKPPETTDDALVTVRPTAHGFSLETRGASAGRVLVALGRAAGRPVRAAGFGAHVRVWAFVREESWDAIADAVARAASLVTVKEADAGIAFVDPLLALRARRKAMLENIELTPIETRVIPAVRPDEAARLLAAMVLSCRGRLVTAPALGSILASDYAGNLNEMTTLLRELERPALVPAAPPAPRPDSSDERDIGSAEEIIRCDSIARVAARNGGTGTVDGDGIAAGDLVSQLAKAKNKNAVIGCGGDRQVFVHAASQSSVEEVARTAGLAPLDAMTFTTADIASRYARASRRAQHRRERPELLVLETPHPTEVAVAIAASFGVPVTAAAYAPTSRVVVRAPHSLVGPIEELARVWEQGVGRR